MADSNLRFSAAKKELNFFIPGPSTQKCQLPFQAGLSYQQRNFFKYLVQKNLNVVKQSENVNRIESQEKGVTPKVKIGSSDMADIMGCMAGFNFICQSVYMSMSHIPGD